MANLDPLLGPSYREDWGTPEPFFLGCQRLLGREFDLDAAADDRNRMTRRFISKRKDALSDLCLWEAKHVWCNPPYGGAILGFAEFAYRAVSEGYCQSVTMLLPARTDTRWFHCWVMNRARNVLFVKGRIQFVGADDPAPFPSVVVVWDRRGSGCFWESIGNEARSGQKTIKR